MPTYTYRCTACRGEFERFQEMTAPALRECPSCGGDLRRVVTGGAGFIIKGQTAPRGVKECSWEREGRTCCGRQEKCAQPPCEDGP